MRWLPGLIAAVSLSGQALKIGQGRATADLALRARPDPNSPVVFQLPSGSELKIINEQTRGPFFRVAGKNGPAGWALASQVSEVAAPAPVSCPVVEPALKKLPKRGEPTILDFNQILQLQMQAERGHIVGVDRAARIGGYLSGKPEGPRPSSSCDGGQNGDWLINIVQDSASKEFEGMVARISATQRNAGWTLERLRSAQEKQYPVLVTGTLFYDAQSFVNDDSANPIPGQLRRAFLWELRQVTSILVCTVGECEQGSAKGWVPLGGM